METKVSIGELAWPEYSRRVKEDAQIILIPIGALEQHGPHMSMNPDVLLPTAISEAVAHRIAAMVAPAIAYGYKSQQKSGGGNHLCGTTSLDGHTLSLTVKDVLKEFARHGARKLCLVNGHFENSMFAVEGVDLALRELRWEGINDFQVVMLSYWDFVTEETIARIYPEGFPGWAVEHGGVLETSVPLRSLHTTCFRRFLNGRLLPGVSLRLRPPRRRKARCCTKSAWRALRTRWAMRSRRATKRRDNWRVIWRMTSTTRHLAQWRQIRRGAWNSTVSTRFRCKIVTARRPNYSRCGSAQTPIMSSS